MSVALNIDFKNLYEIDNISTDLRWSSFRSNLNNGQEIPLVVKISNESHALLPNVYNLAFGPLNPKGKIDDKAELNHADYSKVFSTILFSALAYLNNNPDHYLGIDGSDNARASFITAPFKGISGTSISIFAYLGSSILSGSPGLGKRNTIIPLILRILCLTHSRLKRGPGYRRIRCIIILFLTLRNILRIKRSKKHCKFGHHE